MAIVCSQSFTVRCVPGGNDLVFCYREQQVAIFIVFDLCERTFLFRRQPSKCQHRDCESSYVALQQCRPHLEV